MSWRVALLGMVMIASPGLLAALLTRPASPRVWASSPPEMPSPAVIPPARWDAPARESLAMLRRLVRTEARRSQSALAACEARMRHVGRAHRNVQFRRCATEPLARTDGFARANSRMLSQLAGTAGPTRACRGRVLTLSGVTNSLAFSARHTLFTLDAPWAEVIANSRLIRSEAREALALARGRSWSDTCKPRPPAALERPVA
jgi:hypothetical protein